MRFWDTSSVVPMLVTQTASTAVSAAFETDPLIVAWWGTTVEGASAIARLEREERLLAPEAVDAYRRLEALAITWREIQPSARLRKTAERLLRVHALRAADALQLAAAITAADGDPSGLPFVTLDDRLARAAEREGFPVVVPA